MLKEIRLFEAFAGYGSQLMALRRLEAENPYKLKVIPVGISEIDKYAIAAYNAVHGDVTNYGDISKIDWSLVPDFDMFTYSSPCQDFSSAGLQRGGEKGSGTRSSLLWECERAIAEKRPKYLLMENVSALVSVKFIRLFNRWQYVLEKYGYTNYAMVMNAKDYGVPQNRKRIFMVSILGGGGYEFPKPFQLTRKLGDVLEEHPDENLYLSDKMVDGFIAHSTKHEARGNGFKFETKDKSGIANTVTTLPGSRCTDNFIDCEMGKTLVSRPHGYFRGSESEVCAPCVKSSAYDYNNFVKEHNEVTKHRIRKLSPRECLRLMDVSDTDIDKMIGAGISNSQL